MFYTPFKWDSFWNELKPNQLARASIWPYLSSLGRQILTAFKLKSCVCKDLTKRYFGERFCAFEKSCSWKETPFPFGTKSPLFFTLPCAICHFSVLKSCTHNYDSVENKESIAIIVPNEPQILNFYFQVWLSSLPPPKQHIW